MDKIITDVYFPGSGVGAGDIVYKQDDGSYAVGGNTYMVKELIDDHTLALRPQTRLDRVKIFINSNARIIREWMIEKIKKGHSKCQDFFQFP
jgi:hypothetical protein